MKPHYLLITLSVLSFVRVDAACFARCFGTVPDKCAGEIFEIVEKSNNKLPKKITLLLNRENNASSLIRFIDAEKNIMWALEGADDGCVEIEKSVIKKSDDADPLTWIQWPLKPVRSGTTEVTLSCICKNKNKVLKTEKVQIVVSEE